MQVKTSATKTLKVAAMALVAVATIGLTACKDTDRKSEELRDKGLEEQTAVLASARSAVPTPVMSNYLVRKAVREYMLRMDQPQKTFYTYIFADNGQAIGYYVGQSKPISGCTLMTPPDQIFQDNNVLDQDGQVIAAPNLNGVYNPGGQCDTYFFFDAATDALIEIRGFKYFSSDQPLSVEAEPLKVQKAE